MPEEDVLRFTGIEKIMKSVANCDTRMSIQGPQVLCYRIEAVKRDYLW